MPIKPIEELESFYGADEYGNIYRLVKNGESLKPLAVPRIIKPLRNTNSGYFTFNAWYLGNHKIAYVHQCVIAAHKGARPEGADVHHIDENKANNHLENLEYVVKSQHVRHHIFQSGGIGACVGKFSDEDVSRIISKFYSTIGKRRDVADDLAQEYGSSRGYVMQLAYGASRRVKANPELLKLVEELR